MSNRKYTLKNRLADVITLISFLSLDEHAFRSVDRVIHAVRGNPQSVNSWEDIVNAHPEF